MNIEQNKKYSAIFYAIMLFIFVTFCSCYVYADSTNGVTFTNQPFPISDYPVPLCADSRDRINLYLTNMSTNVDYYICAASGKVYVISESYARVELSSTSAGGGTWIASTIHDTVTNLYYASRDFTATTYYIPYYNTLNDALIAVRDLIDNPPVSATVHLLSTSYIEIDTSNYVKSSMNNTAGIALWSPDNGTTLRCVVATINPNCFITRSSDTAISPVTLYPSAVYDDCFYNTFTTVSADNLSLGYFNDVNSAVSAIYEYLISNGGTPSGYSGEGGSIELPAGYALVLNCTGQTNIGCSLVANNVNNTPNGIDLNTAVYIGQLSSIPDSIDTFPVPNTYRIDTWRPDGNPSLQGTYNKYIYTYNGVPADGSYIIVVNPHTAIQLDQYEFVDEIPSITVSGVFNNSYVFALQGKVSLIDGEIDYSAVSTNTQYPVVYNPETGKFEIEDSNGNPIEDLPYGGANSNIFENFETVTTNFFSWLKGTISNIGQALDTGKSAILSLVGYASGFFGVIQTLYTWLPGPVYSVLSSAIVLVITIGIIKVFI